DFLGREKRFEDRLEQFGRDAGAGVRHGDGDELAVARRLGAEGGGGGHFPGGAGQPAFAVHGVAAVDGEIDQGGLELGDVGNRKAIAVRYLDVDPDPAADEGTE